MIFMSTLGFFPGRSTISGSKFWIVVKLNSAASLSSRFIPVLSFSVPSSFRTSCGISHSIFSSMSCSAMFGKSIFCFAHVKTKFVSKRIFIIFICVSDI
jgi:hypothetical protein